MNPQVVLNNLRKHNCAIFITVTGGGTRVISDLLENGGASDVFIGAEVPYGYTPYSVPEKYVSEEYATILVGKSIENICDNNIQSKFDSMNWMAVGVTAALKKDNERDNRPNEVQLALSFNDIENPKKSLVFRHLNVDKSLNRKAQEDFVTDQILVFINEFLTGAIC